MKALASVTRRFFAELWSDAMLAALVFVPLVMGMVFRFGVPSLEVYLCDRFGRTALLMPYYPIFDLLLSLMTPIMFTAAGAMVILDEVDLGIARAISVTPVGRDGYLLSRIGAPVVLATVYCVAVTLVFRLSDMSVWRLVLLALCSGVLSIASALMISSMANNKVEGLAYSKLSGLFVLGLPMALLVPAPFVYASAFLPTYWMTELATGGSPWLAIPALITGVLLSAAFARHFLKKSLA